MRCCVVSCPRLAVVLWYPAVRERYVISLPLRTTGHEGIITTNTINEVIAGVKPAKAITKHERVETEPRPRERPTDRTSINNGAAIWGCIEAEMFIWLQVGIF